MAKTQKTWHVIPFPIGEDVHKGFAVYREDDGKGESSPHDGNETKLNEQPTRKFQDNGEPLTKKQAIDIARKVAKNNKPSEVVIHNIDKGSNFYPVDEVKSYPPHMDGTDRE